MARLLTILVLLAQLAAPAAAQRMFIPERGQWLDPNGQPLPFQTDEAVLEFLQTAEVVSSKQISEGINDIRKVLLEKGGVQAHAAFRDVHVAKPVMQLQSGTQLNFRDDSLFEVAAYRLSRMLGLDNVPPVVRRSLWGRDGTLQIWVEQCMMEKDRLKKKLEPKHPIQWVYQLQIMHVFDNLIHNDDRNQGNILIDPSWKVWMIDHTRAFRRQGELNRAKMVQYCPKVVWQNLPRLNREELEREMEGLLLKVEIRALLVRRDRLVEHIQELIELKGEGRVLF